MPEDQIPEVEAERTQRTERDLHEPFLVGAPPAPCGGTEKRQHQCESDPHHEVDQAPNQLFSLLGLAQLKLQCLTSLSRADFLSSSGAPGQSSTKCRTSISGLWFAYAWSQWKHLPTTSLRSASARPHSHRAARATSGRTQG